MQTYNKKSGKHSHNRPLQMNKKDNSEKQADNRSQNNYKDALRVSV